MTRRSAPGCWSAAGRRSVAGLGRRGLASRVSGPWQPRAGVAWKHRPHEATTPVTRRTGDISSARGSTCRDSFSRTSRAPTSSSASITTRAVDPSGGNTVFAQTLGHQAEVDDLKGAAFDEIQAGVEHALGDDWRVTTRALYRSQRSGVVGDVVTRDDASGLRQPGSWRAPTVSRNHEDLSRPRDLDVTHGSERSSIGASYLLSSLEGNYEGYWDQTAGVNDPIGGAAFAPSLAATTYASGAAPERSDSPGQGARIDAARVRLRGRRHGHVGLAGRR